MKKTAMIRDIAPLATVDLWAIRLPRDYRIDAAHCAWLDPAERIRAATFGLAQDRRRYIAARVWLRKILARALAMRPSELCFCSRDGKPAVRTVSGGAVLAARFALSHTTNAIVCAIAHDCDVGVDVERLAPIARLESIAAHTLHPREIPSFDMARGVARLGRFYRLWAAKESLLKAIGTGVDIAPGYLAFGESRHGEWRLTDYPRERLGALLQRTYVGELRASDGGRDLATDGCDYFYAMTALAPAVKLTLYEFTAGASTPRMYSEHCRSFDSMTGAPCHAALH